MIYTVEDLKRGKAVLQSENRGFLPELCAGYLRTEPVTIEQQVQKAVAVAKERAAEKAQIEEDRAVRKVIRELLGPPVYVMRHLDDGRVVVRAKGEFVGYFRDEETAKVAMQAVYEGKLL